MRRQGKAYFIHKETSWAYFWAVLTDIPLTRYDVLQVLPDVLEDVQGLLSESSVQSFFLDVSRSQQVDNIFLSAFDEMCNELDDFN